MTVKLSKTDSGIEISNSFQRIMLSKERNGDGLLFSTSVRRKDSWQPLFDAGRPILEGPDFDLIPTEYETVNESPQHAAILLKGIHTRPVYEWDALIEAKENSPWFRIRITCHLKNDLAISCPEPSAALWIKRKSADVTVDQGPVSIYGGNSWGNSFPAAYLWSEGKEAIIFVNPTPMTWMSGLNLKRFLDCRVCTISKDNATGLGLHALSQSGKSIPAGDMIVEYYLYSGVRESKPDHLQALDRTIKVCTELLPSSAPFPENRVEPYETSWKVFAEGVIKDLLRKDISWTDIPSAWQDLPLFPEHEVRTFRLHSDYAVKSVEIRQPDEKSLNVSDGSNTAAFNRDSVLRVWDHITCNDYLGPWIACLRLNPVKEQHEFLKAKIDNVPQFYDREARLFRWHAEGPELSQGQASTMANGVEMSWENFMFCYEPIRIHRMLSPEQFNPAIAGRFLMACQGLIELAHKVDYVFPQWFDAFHKTETIQLDIVALGKVREPFQAGTYAYLMLCAYEMTTEDVYLEEARKSLEYVLHGMEYTVVNRRYTKTYSNPVEIPIAETFGNGYAVAAAQKIYNITGDESFLRYAKDYFNILVRMAFWYDDQADAVSCDLNNLGLFRAHGGHYGTCPWENIEAYLPLTAYLKYNKEPNELLLKLFNLQRATSFYYFGPTWTDLVAEPNPSLYNHVCQYLPIENFYTLEFGGTHGSMGRCIYMCSIAFWNYLLYEAFAETDDREIMVLNLDILEGSEYALQSVERLFLVYNPTGAQKTFTLKMNNLADGDYELKIKDSSDKIISKETRSSKKLAKGWSVTLDAMVSLRVAVVNCNAQEMKADIDTIEAAQSRIAHAYQLLQERARDHGVNSELTGLKKRFLSSMENYRERDYKAAAGTAEGIVKEQIRR